MKRTIFAIFLGLCAASATQAQAVDEPENVIKYRQAVMKAIGGHIGGESGANLGAQAASAAGRMFGLELEGLSEEDQEFEVAKSFVKFAGDAVKKAAAAPSRANPKAVAKAAVKAAARQRAPGLLSSAAATGKSCPTCGRKSSGRWIRRNNQIVLIGA